MTISNTEHEKRDTLSEDVFYPNHDPRTESTTFLHTKASGHTAKISCAISGHTDGTEYHHVYIEWAFADAVDWSKVKAIAVGEITRLPVLDLKTDQPTGDTYPAEYSLVFGIIEATRAKGFDWTTFDPSKPEQFVDSPQNMLVLHSKFHRLKDHGIHVMSGPEWQFQAWPRVAGFVFTPDEVAQ